MGASPIVGTHWNSNMTPKEKVYAVPAEQIRHLYNKSTSLSYICYKLNLGGCHHNKWLKQRFVEEGLDPEKFNKLQIKRRIMVCKLADELKV